jgi:hypothetical protein
MKSVYLRRLYQKYISARLPGFSIKGHLIYADHFDLILRGYCFEDSAFEANAFNIYVFVQPLYSPFNYLWFNFGQRLNQFAKGGVDHWWTISPENEQQIMGVVTDLMCGPALKFLNRVTNPGDLVTEFQRRIKETPNDFNVIEAIAYSRILSGDYRNAYNSLEELKLGLEKAMKDFPYATDLQVNLDRVLMIQNFLIRKENGLAEDQLRLWANSTKEALKL